MTEDNATAGRESPARRLGILYIVSLSGVALLAVASQTFVLRELDHQAHDLRLVGHAASRGVGDEVAHASAKAARRVDRLKAVEYKLFGLMLVVLLFEGVFAISPAVREIR